MKNFLRNFLVLVCSPMLAHAATHIVSQSFFLSGKPDKTWTKTDIVVVLGAQRVEIGEIARARRNFPKKMPIYWMLSDDQWQYNNMSLNKDQKVLDFAAQMQEVYIQVLAPNLCPKPTVLHEKNYDVITLDSNWFLFPHQNEFYKQQCANLDIDKFYSEIEESILNAKLKPVIMVAYHSVHPKLVYGQEQDSLARIASQMSQSLGPMNGISNPAYQRFQERMNRLMETRPNIMFVSGNTTHFFRDSYLSTHYISLPLERPETLNVENERKGAKVTTQQLSKPINMEFNQTHASENPVCKKFDGSMYDFKIKGSFYEYFLGSNYRKLWNQKIPSKCFDLEQESLTIERIGGSLRSPDFQLKDPEGKLYTLRPLKKEIHIPRVLRDTMVEHVLQDQQSSIFPVGFLLASFISKQAGVLAESPRLVYVDADQKSFGMWREKKFPSGFYQLLDQPGNLLKDSDLVEKGVLEVLDTKDMVSKLESVNGYHMDQASYLKARLLDILIGDWDRHGDHWRWVVVQKVDGKIIVPFPIDRESAFYHGNGTIAWWRQRKWINYKLQDYGKILKTAEPMMIQTYSMDHRFTFLLTEKEWDDVVADLQRRLPPSVIEKAIDALPVVLSAKDRKFLVDAFHRRLKELPMLAHDMRNLLRQNVDIVGTAGKDTFSIESNSDNTITVHQMRGEKVVYSDVFNTHQTEEIRFYGLDGDDNFQLTWNKYNNTKIRLIPGLGKDIVTARDQARKPDVHIYDDDVLVDSYYGFLPLNYNPVYNEYYSQVNARKLNVLSPVLFLASSNADSGFILGGGLKYYKEGFQHAPWKSTTELKANLVVNRSAANVMYQSIHFDVRRTWDFITTFDAGLPRFYGSFFGLGNSPPDLDPNKKPEYYWLRARYFSADARMIMPILQYISLVPKAQFRFINYLIDTPSFLYADADNHLNQFLKPTTVDNIGKANYYLDMGMSVNYTSEDDVSGPIKKRIVKTDLNYTYHQGIKREDGHFHSLDVNSAFTGFVVRSKTQWRINFGYGRNFGDWEFFDAQYLGNGQNLRGFFMNRFAGSSRAFASAEVNQSLLFNSGPIITDYGVGLFYDTGRVFLSGDDSERWHKAIGGQAYVVGLNSLAFRVGYAHAVFEPQKGFWSFVLTTEL